jgi:NTP pyrophosphatase (non-canonical NTP hydrolase)
MEINSLIQRAVQVRQLYAESERKDYGRAWTNEEIALGFVGDVGDLVKLVMAQEGIRTMPEARYRLAHELADCLWSVLVLAQAYGVDIERAFFQTMDELEQHIRANL